MNENKKTNSIEICKLFGFPHTVIDGGASDDDNKKFISAVIALLNQIETELDNVLLLESEKEQGYYWAFDTKELTRGSMKERYDAYEIAVRNNILQIDEIRREEDYEPIGFNFIKLGLQDVLLNPETMDVFTPNTGQTKNLLTGEERAEDVELRYRQYIQGPDGKMQGSRNVGGSGGNHAKSVDKSEKPDIIKLEDIEVGKSVGAKAKNYDIMDLETGEHFRLVEGTSLQDVEVFAGKGVKAEYRQAEKFAKTYGGKAKDWQHAKGKGTVDFYGEGRKAELHWSQCKGVGKHEFFIKRWLE